MANEFGKVHVGIVASTGGLVAGLNTASTSLQKFGVMAKGAAGGATAGGFQALSTGILGTGVAAKIASFGVKSLTSLPILSGLRPQQQQPNLSAVGEPARANC